MKTLRKPIESAPSPAAARAALERIADAWPGGMEALTDTVEHFPGGPEPLIHLLAVSPVSVRKIEHRPERLQWLADPSVLEPLRGHTKLDLQLRAYLEREPNLLRAVREFKCRELLRVALREAGCGADISETGPLLADIAATCVRKVLEHLLTDAAKRWGEPGTDLAVLGMGKFGGMELNFSSDIDIVAVHGEDGNVRPGFSRQEYFSRVLTRLASDFQQTDENAGGLFPVDLRLRPEGGSGPLTRSLDSMENYYAGYGEVWERMALTKARLIAGGEELAYDFERTLQPFVYPRHFAADTVEEVYAIKRRIERDLLGREGVEHNVKLGRGGIREIEFIVQTLQLLHGARHAFLQEHNTLKALEALSQVRLLEPGRADALADAYVFLRKVEHRLQIVHEHATHSLPTDPGALQVLARSLQFQTADDFFETLNRHRAVVRDAFENILSDQAEESTARESPPSTDFFRDPEAAEKRLNELGAESKTRHVAPRTKRLYRRLEPLLLTELSRCADSDQSLAFFVQFVERYGIRGLLYETLAANPRLLELLIRLFDASRYLTASVLRRPQWIEEIARAGLSPPPPTPEAHLEAMSTATGNNDPAEALRIHKAMQELRIALRDLLGLSDLDTVVTEFTVLADACVTKANELAEAGEMTIVALGKYGGRELAYGADLDIVLVGSESTAKKAAAFLKFLSGRSGEGIVFPTDCRLRPEGDASPLVVPLSRYETYWRDRAQFWELQALTKARVIAGPDGAAFSDAARRAWESAGKKPDLFAEVRAMHDRIVQHRSRGDGHLSFKTGAGGLIAAEFFVQAHQMKHGIHEPNTLAAIKRLEADNLLPLPAAETLADAIHFFRRCELTLRRLDNAAVSEIPSDELPMRQFVKRMGYDTPASFFENYDAHRANVGKLFESLGG